MVLAIRPRVAEGIGVTVIYPNMSLAVELFEAVGRTVIAASLKEFDSYVVASARMGMYFEVMDTL